MTPEDRMGMVRVTGEAWHRSPDYVRDIVRQLDPRSGDLLIIKAHPSRIAALESNLRSQLIPQGLVDA